MRCRTARASVQQAMRAIPSSLRLLNQRRVLEELLAVKAASRAELAARLGMSRPTAGKIIDELLETRVVEERQSEPITDDVSHRSGRPGRTVFLEGRTPRLILVQIGVHTTDLMAVPLSGVSGRPWAISYPTPNSQAAFMQAVDGARAALQAPEAWAFGVSFPGIYDERSERACLSPNMHWMKGTELVPRLEERWGLPGCGIQEIRALALGHRAHEPSMRDFLLVDSQDGVGAAAVLGGALFEGPRASSGELGHTLVAGNDRVCGCGATGCLETLVSRPGLLKSFAQRAQQVQPAQPSWEELRRAWALDVPPWMEGAIAALAEATGAALNILGLDQVVLTGVFDVWPAQAIERLRAHINHASLWARLGEVNVRVAPQRRADGLVQRLFDRVIIPQQDRRAHTSFAPEPKL